MDDLKPGVLMARATGVAIAAAGWSHQVAEIERYMRAQADVYCARIDDLRAILLPRLMPRRTAAGRVHGSRAPA